MSAIPIVCQYCGAALRMGARDERTETSAWVADTPDGLAPCITEAPGHAPSSPGPMRIWLIHDDGTEREMDVVRGEHVAITAIELAARNQDRAEGRFELRPI